jgi:hypothetical protein
MSKSFVIAELTLLVVTSLGWILGFLQHKFPQGKDAIQVPSSLGEIFSLKKRGIISLRGILIQILACSIFIIVTLFNLGTVSRGGMSYMILITSVLLAILVGVHHLR